MDRGDQLGVREELLQAFKQLEAEKKCGKDEIRVRSLVEVTMFGRCYLFADSKLSAYVDDNTTFKVRDLHDLMTHCSKSAADEIVEGVRAIVEGEDADESDREDEGDSE